MAIKVKPKEATAIINSLISGVVPKTGVQHITVGRSREVEMVLQALAQVQSGHSMMKFWVGDFGSGKSFMLHLLNTVALRQKFVVTQADLTPHIRVYSNDGKGQALYTALMDNIAIQTKPEGGALHILLEKWIEQVIVESASQHGIPLTEIRDAQHTHLITDRIMKTVGAITDVGGFDFGLAVSRYYEGFIHGDDDLKNSALRWLKGEYQTKTDAKRELGVGDIINDRNYYDMLKNFSKLFVSIGYSGLVVNLDEAINLYKITNPGMRQRNYEKLLSMYNDCFQGKVEHFFFNVAATTDTLEDPKRGFYSYEAMKSRLSVNKYETAELRDYAQPVVRLMPLSHNEIFVLLDNLKDIFDFNYSVNVDFGADEIKTFMEEIYNKPGASQWLTPREVIRDFLNILNILRQNPQADKAALFEQIGVREEQAGWDAGQTAEDEAKLRLAKKREKQLRGLLLPDETVEILGGTLLDDENVLKTVTGSLYNEAGTLMATERRLLFLSKKGAVHSFPYAGINGISFTQGPQSSVLNIDMGKETRKVDFIPNNKIKPLLNLLQAQIDVLERKTLAAELKYWEKMIADQKMKERLERMGRIAEIITEKDPHKGEVFFMRHADTVTKLLKQYYTIEVSAIESQEMADSRERIAVSIATVQGAFEQELENILKSDMLDIDAESMAYMQSLRNRGLIADKND